MRVSVRPGFVWAALLAALLLGVGPPLTRPTVAGLDNWGVSIARPASPAGTAARVPGPQGLLVDSQVSQEDVDRATRVKARHEGALMSIAGVVGVGVGLDGAGRVVIQVYVVQATPEVRQAIPADLEGVPVSIIETGEFEPR